MTKKMEKTLPNESPPTEEAQGFDIHDVFSKRDNFYKKHELKEAKQEAQKSSQKNDENEEDHHKTSPEVKTKGDKDKGKEEIREKNAKEDQVPDNSVEKLKIDLEKAQKEAKESRKWASDISRQIAAYKRSVKRFQEEGGLSEDEAALLLDHTKFEEVPQEQEKTVLQAWGEIWDREIENMRKYADMADLDRHLRAFQHFLYNSSQEELDEAYERLSSVDPEDHVGLTKEMLKIAREYDEEGYADLYEAGNIKQLKSRTEQIKKDYERKIDKLEKEILKLKERTDYYQESSTRLPPPGSDRAGEEEDKNAPVDVNDIFRNKERFYAQQARRG